MYEEELHADPEPKALLPSNEAQMLPNGADRRTGTLLDACSRSTVGWTL